MNEAERFDEFLTELEKLCVKYGVVLRSAGGVSIYDENDVASVKYIRDHTSGDLDLLTLGFSETADIEQTMNKMNL